MLTFEDKERVSSEEAQNEDIYELSPWPVSFLHVCSDICLHRPSLIPIVSQHKLQIIEMTLYCTRWREKCLDLWAYWLVGLPFNCVLIYAKSSLDLIPRLVDSSPWKPRDKSVIGFSLILSHTVYRQPCNAVTNKSGERQPGISQLFCRFAWSCSGFGASSFDAERTGSSSASVFSLLSQND